MNTAWRFYSLGLLGHPNLQRKKLLVCQRWVLTLDFETTLRRKAVAKQATLSDLRSFTYTRMGAGVGVRTRGDALGAPSAPTGEGAPRTSGATEWCRVGANKGGSQVGQGGDGWGEQGWGLVLSCGDQPACL